MLTLSELRRAAARLGLGLGQAEHEYMLLCALDALGKTPLMQDSFALKGGTALRQLYFADWRHSVDLDFSVASDYEAGRLREGLTEWFARIEALHGIPVTLRDFHRPNGAARVRARFVGPLGHPSQLLLDITFDEILVLPWEHRPVVTGLYAQPTPLVRCYALAEILAEKLRAVLQRGKSRDYYDVWRLLKEKGGAFDQAVVCSVLDTKCAHRGLSLPSVAGFLNPVMLAQAEVFWRTDLAEQVRPNQLPLWEQVISEIEPLLSELLAHRL